MCEGENHLVHKLINAYCARDRRHCGIRRHRRDEVSRVKMAKLVLAAAARHHGHMVDISVFDHGGQRSLGIARLEFIGGVLLPDPNQRRISHKRPPASMVIIACRRRLYAGFSASSSSKIAMRATTSWP